MGNVQPLPRAARVTDKLLGGMGSGGGGMEPRNAARNRQLPCPGKADADPFRGRTAAASAGLAGLTSQRRQCGRRDFSSSPRGACKTASGSHASAEAGIRKPESQEADHGWKLFPPPRAAAPTTCARGSKSLPRRLHGCPAIRNRCGHVPASAATATAADRIAEQAMLFRASACTRSSSVCRGSLPDASATPSVADISSVSPSPLPRRGDAPVLFRLWPATTVFAFDRLTCWRTGR